MADLTTQYRPYPCYRPSGVPWLGDVPEHWDARRGKALLRPVDIRSKTGDEELLTVSAQRGVVPRKSANVTMFKAESYVGYKLCWPGDLVINSLWAWAHGLGVSQHHGIVSSAYGVYRPLSKVHDRFIHLLARSVPFQWELQVRSKGIWVSRLQLTDEEFLRAPFPLPPLPEQRAIARYLDHVDRRIRHYVAAKRKLIGLLEEEKQAIVNRVVTRGLDPNVRLKPSGVEWLGDVPEHWEMRRSKRLFSPRQELARPNGIQLSATQAYGVIPQDEYERKAGRRIVKISLHLDKRRHVEVDDFVISMRSFQGGLERAWATGCIRSSYIVLRPTAEVDVEFFSYVFKSRAYIGALQSTANFIRDGQDLNFNNFCAVDLPLPPAREQRSIAAALAEATANIGTAIARSRRQIDLVQEYRTRLIADVVTGKLDVREAAAQLPKEDDEAEPIDGDGLIADTTDDDLYDAEEEPAIAEEVRI